MFQVLWRLWWQNQLLWIRMAKHRPRDCSWCPVVEKKAPGSQQIHRSPNFLNFPAHTRSQQSPQASQSSDRRPDPIVEEKEAQGRQQIFTKPQTTWKPPSHAADEKKARGIHENSADPNTIIQEGAWPYLMKLLFWEQWGNSKILGPSPVPLVTSWLLLLDGPAHPVSLAHGVGATTTKRIQHWKLHESIFFQSLIKMYLLVVWSF